MQKNHDSKNFIDEDFDNVLGYADLHGITVNQIRNNRLKQYYKSKIDLYVKDKIVIDLGSGSGILSYMAILGGAKKVIAIEKDKFVSGFLKHSIKKLGWDNQIVVVNKDFVHDDISPYLEEADVCVGEFITSSFTSNIFPCVLKKIKENFPSLKIIPEQISYQTNIVENKFLTKFIEWGYDDNLNSVFDKIFLELSVLEPVKIRNISFEHHRVFDSKCAITYNFETNSIVSNNIVLPKDKTNKWLEIYWNFNNEIYDDYWQKEYIPLHIKFFDGVDQISLTPQHHFHKIQKVG